MRMRETRKISSCGESWRAGVLDADLLERLVRAWPRHSVLLDWHLAERWVNGAGRREPLLLGVVFNHRKKPDGMYIQAGRIEEVCGTQIHSEKSTYELGTMNPIFEAHIRESCGHIDAENPAGHTLAGLIGLAVDGHVDARCRAMIDVLWPRRPGAE